MPSDRCQVPMPRYLCQVKDAKQLDVRSAVHGQEEVDGEGDLLLNKLTDAKFIYLFIHLC